MVKKLVLEGTISCIHHDYTGSIGEQAALFNPKGSTFSQIDVKVGRKELAIIRPNGTRFNWKGKGEIHSGDRIRITLEIVKK
ncbi:MAG: hypothetical protein UT24_C0003G0060 [Candidatus Woesebacteria bacterium GW2011_GWB1_39_12]|uniref:Uncharacterized protein n=1 Tax=Candidatus Woesebacteria bacterium GW2011_GWB1_39_12 TaxID=1618574 RepID=A0A0G0MEP8_9BACT|nr:MAG: hypothetical protein UT24_C0003G0060 [Candidatus Woesebacteria bacterium GW2011_GWB1_39_12]